MMRTRAGSSLLPVPVLAKATHWEEGAMTNPDIAHANAARIGRRHGRWRYPLLKSVATKNTENPCLSA